MSVDQDPKDADVEERDRADDRARFLSHPAHSFGLPSLFYGSLQAPEVFGKVVGTPLSGFQSEPVQLAGYKTAVVMAGGGFPGIFLDPDAAPLECLLVHGLSHEQRHRVAWYEWDEYRIERFRLVDGREAEAFVPFVETIERLHGPVTYKPWTYAHWRAQHLSDAADGVEDWMAEMPDVSSRLSTCGPGSV